MFKKIIAAGFAALLAGTALAASKYDKPGFVTFVDDNGRLWVFKADAKELADYEKAGAPAIHVSKIGEGPEGMTIKALSYDVIDAYQAAK